MSQDLSWMDEAVCAQVWGDLWFPECGGHSIKPQRIRRTCPVASECLAYVLDAEYGIWGGRGQQARKQPA
jgi:WhiB family redox-sensing transcriptional regulator